MTRMMYYATQRWKECCCNIPKMADSYASANLSALVGRVGFIKYDKYRIWLYGDTYDYEQYAEHEKYYCGYSYLIRLLGSGENYTSALVLCNGETLHNAGAYNVGYHGQFSYHMPHFYSCPEIVQDYVPVWASGPTEMKLYHCLNYSNPKLVQEFASKGEASVGIQSPGTLSSMACVRCSDGFSGTVNAQKLVYHYENEIDRYQYADSMYGDRGQGMILMPSSAYTQDIYYGGTHVAGAGGQSLDGWAQILTPYYWYIPGSALYYCKRLLTHNVDPRNFGISMSGYNFCSNKNNKGIYDFYWDGAKEYSASFLPSVEAGRQLAFSTGLWYYGNKSAIAHGSFRRLGNYIVSIASSGTFAYYQGREVYRNLSMRSTTQYDSFSDLDNVAINSPSNRTRISLYAGNVVYEGDGSILSVAGKSVAIRVGNRLMIYHKGKLVHDRQYDLIAAIPSSNGTLFVRADDRIVGYDEDLGFIRYSISQLAA